MQSPPGNLPRVALQRRLPDDNEEAALRQVQPDEDYAQRHEGGSRPPDKCQQYFARFKVRRTAF